jgi:hypothetical protein
LGRDAGRNAATGAGLIEDDNLLVPDLAELVGKDAGGGVVGAADGGVYHDPHRLVGIDRLRQRRARQQRRE